MLYEEQYENSLSQKEKYKYKNGLVVQLFYLVDTITEDIC